MTQIKNPRLKIDILMNMKYSNHWRIVYADCPVTILADLGETVIIKISDNYESVEVYKSILK